MFGYTEASKASMKAMRADGPTRLDRVAVNNLETLPVALATLWAACSVGTDPSTMAIIYAVFLGTRLLYGVCYMLGIQPFRTIFWLAGNITVITAVVYGCLAAGINDLDKFLPMLFTGCVYLMQLGLLLSVKDLAAHPPEDTNVGVTEEAVAEAEAAKGSRLARVLVNAHEAVPMGLVTLWAAYNSGAEPKVMTILFAVYFGARLLYIPCYLLALAPWRSLMYLAGQFSVISAASYGIIAAGSDYEKILPIAATLALFIMQMLAFHASPDVPAHPAEDDAYFGAAGLSDEGRAQWVAERAEGPTRLDRVMLNQHENFSMALVVLWGAIKAGANAEAIALVFATYLGLRVIYALCYLCAIQPFRTLSFLFSLFAVIAAIVFSFLHQFHVAL